MGFPLRRWVERMIGADSESGEAHRGRVRDAPAELRPQKAPRRCNGDRTTNPSDAPSLQREPDRAPGWAREGESRGLTVEERGTARAHVHRPQLTPGQDREEGRWDGPVQRRLLLWDPNGRSPDGSDLFLLAFAWAGPPNPRPRKAAKPGGS